MSTPEEKRAAISLAVKMAERRLKELNDKPFLSRPEQYEKDMTEDCIRRGCKLLNMPCPLKERSK